MFRYVHVPVSLYEAVLYINKKCSISTKEFSLFFSNQHCMSVFRRTYDKTPRILTVPNSIENSINTKGASNNYYQSYKVKYIDEFSKFQITRI